MLDGHLSSSKFYMKMGRTKKKFLSPCTAVITVMYAIFKLNPIVSDGTCVLYNVHPTLFYTSVPSVNLTTVSSEAESQIFHL